MLFCQYPVWYSDVSGRFDVHHRCDNHYTTDANHLETSNASQEASHGLGIVQFWFVNCRLDALSKYSHYGLGFVACIAALVRFTTLVYTKHSTNLTCMLFTLSWLVKSAANDFLADQGATSLIWMNVEYSLGLISGSISSLRVLFRIKSIFSNKDDSRNMSNDGGLGKAYELGSRNKFGTSGSKSGWKGGGILKTSEVTVHGESRNESQERIVSAV